jgi:hypothetical protein
MKTIQLEGERRNKKEDQCPTKRHHLAKLNNKKVIHLEGKREGKIEGSMSNKKTSSINPKTQTRPHKKT